MLAKLASRGFQIGFLVASAFLLLLSLLFASHVRDQLAAQSAAPALGEAPAGAVRDDWMSARLALGELDEIGSLLRDKRMDEAKQRMQSLLKRFPRTEAADEARRILSQIHLDEFHARKAGGETKTYRVRSGDSPLAIARRLGTTYISLAALNGEEALGSLRPGDELLYRPLNDALHVLPGQGRIELRRGNDFLAAFPLVGKQLAGPAPVGKVSISELIGYVGRSRKRAIDPGFTSSRKVIGLKGTHVVLAAAAPGEASAHFEGYFLKPGDINELIRLVKPGNEVVFSPET